MINGLFIKALLRRHYYGECPDMQYEDAFVKMLDDVDRFEIKGSELTFFDDDKSLAVFKAVEKEPAKK